MAGFLKALFDDNTKDIKRYSKVVESINMLEGRIASFSDAELRAKTDIFREQLADGISVEQIMPEVFAVCREASRRVLNMRHFDVQLIGGLALADGRIAEMKTGEGKTLVATAPAYLKALEGKGVHVVTVNDYLARRDSEWMGRLYEFLGLSVGLVVAQMPSADRREAYNCDITYATNNELGFDYLRDNMARVPQARVQRGLYYAIVDEVDSILIDEARTPLIISGSSGKPTQLYYQMADIIPRLKNEVDYTVDEKTRTVALTEQGSEKIENMLGLEDLYDDKNTEISHYVNQALRAQTLFRRDRDYVVKDGQVIIVDEFTGRLMFGRRYSEGLHQSIEAKEKVQIERETQTLASVTFQNYFRMYNKLSGMTGTAKTEEDEFRNIYGFDVVQIPTNMPMIRSDFPDVIYRSQNGKYQAIVEEISQVYATGRPVLVGTVSIEKSEIISSLLKKRGLQHNVLNAKYHDKEAEIVAQAGRKNAITIATNMAGRGTDIILGGNHQTLAQAEVAKETAKGEIEFTPAEILVIEDKYKRQTAAEHDEVVALGGLHIIGTERHDSRRIDNQLRGRAGRQGDPGSSRFYISMDDDLMRLFGGDNLAGMMDKLGMDDTTPIDSGMVTKSLENAQKKVEYRNFEMRKNVLQYDDVMNAQREVIYGERRKALEDSDLRESMLHMFDSVIERIVENYAVSNYPEEWDLDKMLAELGDYLSGPLPAKEDIAQLSNTEIGPLFIEIAHELYEKREQELGEDVLRQIERILILRVVDSKWMDHLDAMDQMRQGIGLQAYGQRDPLIQYKYEAYDMFQAMIEDIQSEVCRMVLRLDLVPAQPTEENRNMVASHGDSVAATRKKPIVRKAEQKIGRNDLCPCGSGKKYKNCCGKN